MNAIVLRRHKAGNTKAIGARNPAALVEGPIAVHRVRTASDSDRVL